MNVTCDAERDEIVIKVSDKRNVIDTNVTILATFDSKLRKQAVKVEIDVLPNL